MGIVIGYKGTKKERRESWITILKLRSHIRKGEDYIRRNSQKDVQLPDLTEPRQWLAEEYQAYVKAA